MRFRGQEANRIDTGRKTEHRIPRTEPQEPPFAKGRVVPVTVMLSNPQLGYQRRNPDTPRKEGHTVCHIEIDSCNPDLLHEAGESGARAEGHHTFDALIDSWWDRYRTGCGRPGEPHYPVHIPVWTLRFHRSTEHRPRLLSPASDVNRGYTESPAVALHDPGEAVEDEWLERFAQDSAHDKLLRLVKAEGRIRERALEDRLAAVREAARREGVDVTRQLAAIERRVRAAEAIVKKYGKAA